MTKSLTNTYTHKYVCKRVRKCACGCMGALIFASRNIRFDIRPKVEFRPCGLFIFLFLPFFMFLFLSPFRIDSPKFLDSTIYQGISPLSSTIHAAVSLFVQFCIVCRIARFPGLTNFHRTPFVPLALTRAVCCVYGTLEFHAR